MTLTLAQIGLYTSAMAILFLTPGPVWVALIARAVGGGFHAAWPLALGVVVGDLVWPVLAIFGVAVLVELYAEFLTVLRYGGAIILAYMGVQQLRKANKPLVADPRLQVRGILAGFTAGLMVIIGNPKAILFYMGVLPGFFDLKNLTGWDVLAISLISGLVPFCGNILFGLFVGRVRRFLSSPAALRRTHIASGVALILVGLGIAVLS